MDAALEVETISEVDRTGDFYAEKVNVAIDRKMSDEIISCDQHEKEAHDA